MKKRLCIIGLDRVLAQKIKTAYFGPVIFHELLPEYKVLNGKLYIPRSNGIGFLPVDKVIFHGIFENDFDLITALAIWGGDCFPNALAMMNCRLKLPCLARALKISRFNSQRGMVGANTKVTVNQASVAKWGNWHCGENKEKFETAWISTEPSIVEPFFEGEAVRIVSIGDEYLQIKLAGQSWLKSIHDEKAHITNVDSELLADTLHIKETFGMDMIANDYIVNNHGEKHLLEVNHIPNMTRFQDLQDMYLKKVISWINE